MTGVAEIAAAPIAEEQPDLFGHPLGMTYTVTAEGLAYFAYTGTQALMMLYMTQRLFTPGHLEHVIGFTAYRAVLEAGFGHLTLLGLASQTFGLFTGLMYALTLVGAIIADRWTGQRAMVFFGLALAIVGYTLVAIEPTFLIGLLLTVLASGCYKTNLLGMIGRLYAPGDSRSERGYGVYLIAINVGSFASPLICGALAQAYGFAAGFAPLAIAAFAALAITLVARRNLPLDSVRHRRDGTAPEKLKRGEYRVVAILLAMILVDIVFTGTYNQSFDILPVWADAHVNRSLFGFTMPTPWFSSLDGIFTILGTLVSMRLWAWQAKRGREPGFTSKVMIGLAMTVVAFGILALGALSPTLTPIVFPVIYFALIDTAITWCDLTILSKISSAAPQAVASTMIGLYMLSTTAGNFMVGWLGTLYERMPPSAFWATHGGIVLALLPLLLLASPYIRRSFARVAT